MEEQFKICANCKHWATAIGGLTVDKSVGKCILSRNKLVSFPNKKKMHSNCGLTTTRDFGCTEFTPKK